MPRIALLFEYPTLNGGERSMLAVLDAISRDVGTAAFDFVAVAPETGPLAEALGERGIAVSPLRIRDERGRRLPPAGAVERLRETLETCDADLLHANSLAMARLTGALGESFRRPRVAHLRDIIKLSAAAVADLNRNDRLVAVSRATREFHVVQGLDADKTEVIYNGVDGDVFSPSPTNHNDRKLLKKLGIPQEAFVVLTIGQIGLRKGQDVLAEAALALQRSHESVSREIHYLVVGERNSNKPESVAFEENLKQRFAEAGLRDRLHLTGYRNDVPRLMQEADLLAHPAKQEPLGRVLLEAAACGLPIVATDVGGTAEILTDGLSARLVPPGDATALAAAIVELAASRVLGTGFSSAARDRVTSRFSIASSAREMTSLWRSALEKDGGDSMPGR